jgi:hypothetical protein
MKLKANEILDKLGITEEVIGIYPYGSRVYGTASSKSDHDFIIVTKSATLSNGAFKNNAISSDDWSIQGVLYSRGGFLDAINNYEIGALECISLPEEEVILETTLLKSLLKRPRKWIQGDMVKNIIKKASNSWFIADKQAKTGYKDRAKKGIYHSLRILRFGLQLKENQRVVDFSESNELYYQFKSIPEDEFDSRKFIPLRDSLMKRLRDGN